MIFHGCSKCFEFLLCFHTAGWVTVNALLYRNKNTQNTNTSNIITIITTLTRMWANAQRDGRPAEHTWRPLFNAAKFG